MTGLLVVPASVGLASASQAAVPSSPSLQGFLYSGNAYGTFVTSRGSVLAGKSAVSTLCTSADDSGHGTGMAGVEVPDLISTGEVSSSAITTSTSSTESVTISAAVQSASLLSGLITATAIRADSTVSYDGVTFNTGDGVARFADLVVDGNPVKNRPAANTVIRLPDVGKVIINERRSSVGATAASLTVTMLHVYVNHNIPGVVKGTEILVSHAASTLVGDQAGSIDGAAFGTWGNGASHVGSGHSASVEIGCGGTGGAVKTSSVAGIDDQPAVTTGQITDTAQGTITAAAAIAETTATVDDVNMLEGLVTADSVKADAHASTTGDQIDLSDSGSGFANLVVNGVAIDDDVAANTKIVVGNVSVWLHRVTLDAFSIEVRGIEVIVTGSNPYGLEVGSRIQVAVARAVAF
jgi:hypothetical protein